jgi:hypothetical protein
MAILPPCNEVVETRAELRAFKEYSQQALILAAKASTDKYEDLNELRKEYTTDRARDQEQFLKKDIYNARVNYYDKYIEDTRRGHDDLVSRVVLLEHDKSSRENNEELADSLLDKKLSSERFKTNRNILITGIVLTTLNILLAFIIHVMPK